MSSPDASHDGFNQIGFGRRWPVLAGVSLAYADQTPGKSGGGLLLCMGSEVGGNYFGGAGNASAPSEEVIQIGSVRSAGAIS